MTAKMAANGIRTRARTNQRTLEKSCRTPSKYYCNALVPSQLYYLVLSHKSS